jgi:regulator of RNase E activity RraB
MFKDVESQLEEIREIFAEAKQEDNWNLDEPHLFTYYFVDADVDKLEKLGNHLQSQGYDFIDVFELGDEETEKPTGEYLLHIDREEVHTPESLAERNVEFSRLAEEFGVETYDGWEFGQVGDYDDEEEEDVEVESPS